MKINLNLNLKTATALSVNFNVTNEFVSEQLLYWTVVEA